MNDIVTIKCFKKSVTVGRERTTHIKLAMIQPYIVDIVIVN